VKILEISTSWNIFECRRFDLIVNTSASPFHAGKFRQRQEIVGRCARHFQRPVFYCNLLAGRTTLVFDGHQYDCGADGTILATGNAFEDDILLADADVSDGAITVCVPQSNPSLQSPMDPWPRCIGRWCWARGIMYARTALKSHDWSQRWN
jgi:hypothetical protein